jgi:iron complex outermembrane receptor protein
MNRKISMLSGVAMLCLTQTAYAQTAPAKGEVDELIVTGIRGSLQRAAELKRDAPQVLDVITAEDVGKLPDANVAEALQRVTGVQITRVFGEGQTVSVRGLQQVRVEVDGRTLLGYSARLSPPENEQLGRSSGLDSVPSSLFGRLEVRKTPLASDAEGGLGGTINLVTPKPFDFADQQVTLRAQTTYSDVSDKFEPGFTGLVSKRFFEDRLGVLISAEYQKRTSTIQAFERNNFLNRNYTVAGQTTPTVQQTPVLLQYETFVVDRSRRGVNGSVQFEVTPEFVVTGEALYSKLVTGRYQDFLSWRLPTGNNPVTNASVQDGFVVAGAASGTLNTAGQIRKEPTESFLYALNGRYDNGRLKVVADGYYSKGTIDQTIQIITLQGVAAVPGTFDFRDRTVPSLVLGTGTTPYDLTNPANYALAANGVRSNRLIGALDEWTGKLDLDYELNDSVSVSAGVRYTDLSARSNAYRSQTTRPRDEIFPARTGLTSTSFNGDIDGAFPRVFLTSLPTFDYVSRTAQAAQPNPDASDRSALLPNVQRDYNFSEETLAGYLMVSAQGELAGMPVRANAGVRVAKTDLSVDSFQQTTVGTVVTFTPVTDRNSFSDILPSVNIAFNVTDDFLVRLSGSRTLQRAGVADLAPSTFFNQTNLTVSGGNANLKPPIATQGDLSFEYYTGGSSLISGAIFYKSVDDFIATATVQEVFPGGPAFPIPTTRPFNIAEAKVKGFEVGVQQFLDFLPAPFDGLGFIANYTYSDSQDNQGFPLVAVSKNSYNLVGLYEKGRFSGRVAYNYRDKALFEFSEGRPSFIGKRSQLDAQVGYDLNARIALQFQVQNLLPKDSATVEYSGSDPTALNSYSLSERRYTFGLRLKL